MAGQFDYLFKLVLIGDSGVGKTCIIFRFVENKFDSSFITTIGIDFKIRTVEIDGKKIKLQIWDTAGQDRFETITSTCYRGAHGIMLVYDVTDEKSFRNIPRWIRKTEELASPDVTKMLVANKCDLEKRRLVTKERGELLARNLELPFKEISALSNLNVEDAFSLILKRVFKQAVSPVRSWAERTLEQSVAQGDLFCKPTCCM
ncbi:ras-related protein Rab-8A-like [Porites lutea]|uniref:ras-related protein Rab-8A-like n=1 Tax=Porites lutea TaxID=51062 RepID=UPI003CC5B93E